MPNNLQEFNVKSVPLLGTNLIEASAGTGKTYSIAILVLRLILEKEMLLKQILMVTFTKAAVAELEGRVRKFIRAALNFAQSGIKTDELINTLIKNSIEKKGAEKIISLLKDARMQLDETSIFTIHSFCQNTLNEFAFETGQLFNSVVVEDQSTLVEKVSNEFWRKKITTLDLDLLLLLKNKGLSRS